MPKHQRVSQQQPAEPRPEPVEAGQSLIGGGEEGGGGFSPHSGWHTSHQATVQNGN